MTGPSLTSRLLARNTLYNLLGQGLPLVIAAVALPLVVHQLGPARFGILALGWMILGYVGELGFGRATTKFAAEALGHGDTARLVSVVWGTVVMQLAIGGAGALVIALSAATLTDRILSVPPELSVEALHSFYVLAAGLPVLMVASSVRGVLEAAQRFGAVNAVRVPASGALYLLPLAGVALGLRLPGILALMLLARLVTVVVFSWMAVRLFPALARPRVQVSSLGELFRFGSWAAVSTVLAPLMMYLDRFMLGALAGVAAIAYYAPPFELAVRLSLVPAAVVATLFPAFSMLMARRDTVRLQRLVGQAVAFVLLALGPVAIVLMAGAHDLLELWLGAEFAAEGARALQIMLAGVLINALAYVPFTLIQAIGRPDVTAKLHLVELPVHLLLTWLFISRWGVPGAALAWTARVSIDTVLLFWAAARLHEFPLTALATARIPRAAALLAAFGGGVVLVTGLVPGTWARLGLLAVAFSVMVPILWRWGLGAADRDSLRGLLAAGRTT
jgi:O-antigen/teichoic acid export membrane protein